MSGGAIGAIIWFELALVSGLYVLMPAVLFASALCDAGPECSPSRAVLRLLLPGLGIGAAFLVAVTALDLGARRWRPIAVVELLAGLALVAITILAFASTLRGDDTALLLIASLGLLSVPGVGLIRAGYAAARIPPP